MKFGIGDKLVASEFDSELYRLEFVTITDINVEDEIYHWEASALGGVMHSGYRFSDAVRWIPKDERRDEKLNSIL
jgi:hypothetical protein